MRIEQQKKRMEGNGSFQAGSHLYPLTSHLGVEDQSAISETLTALRGNGYLKKPPSVPVQSCTDSYRLVPGGTFPYVFVRCGTKTGKAGRRVARKARSSKVFDTSGDRDTMLHLKCLDTPGRRTRMKVSLNWLTDYVDISVSAAELGEQLTQIGLNLEEIIETPTDVVLDLEVTSNRPDCLGHLGIAREIAAATGAEFRPPEIPNPPTSGKVGDLAAVEVLDDDLCPRYTARVIRGVKVGPSPGWMVERLEAIGLRSINNIVDATNYVLMEYSQPLHSFDYDKLTDHKIIVRRAESGEMLVSIDETHCRLDEQMLVIADAEKCVAIAGVMGGLSTEVTEATSNVLIESAQFDPLVTRRTSRTLQLMSESNYRFERGVDPVGVNEASLRAAQLIIEIAGGELAEGVLDVWADPWKPRTVSLRPERCDALLGVETPQQRQKEILSALGLSPKLEGGSIVCTIPSHRADLQREVDLIEEVPRVQGYYIIPVSSHLTNSVRAEGLPQQTRRMVTEAMTGGGFDETVTSTFVDGEEAALFGPEGSVSVDTIARKTNNVLRATLIPSLLRACKTNQDNANPDVSLFELAGVFFPKENSALTEERVELAGVSTRDLRTLRGVLEEAVFSVAGQAVLTVRPESVKGFADGISAVVLIDSEPVGSLGMIAGEVLDYYGLNPDRPIAAGRISFDALLARAGAERGYEPLAKFPPVRRDLSVVVDGGVTWGGLLETVLGLNQPMCVGLDYVTTYRGEQIGGGRKSVTFTVTYRSPQATLRSEEVDAQIDEIVSVLKKEFAAELRA